MSGEHLCRVEDDVCRVMTPPFFFIFLFECLDDGLFCYVNDGLPMLISTPLSAEDRGGIKIFYGTLSSNDLALKSAASQATCF